MTSWLHSKMENGSLLIAVNITTYIERSKEKTSV